MKKKSSYTSLIKKIVLLVPAILLYILFFGFGSWVVLHAQDMETFTPGLLAIWVVLLLTILLTAIIITAQYSKWLDKEKTS
ncbi:hypothetical protein [Pontibacillus marinus]|uniref:Uncharacterized protein n=1 Tax=Pontibacillus marinus BH030004 = DSM 16465 TaxID=1385511 RepID=A0A0A5HKV1_9BACI|nr:hypothetical protein [Pontibacillus marinus]KGX84267.1 hypothetical protein N783_18015 [Pontibacillus marinus BH030004 = DSM 16465]